MSAPSILTYRRLLVLKSGACLAGAPLVLLAPRWFYGIVGIPADSAVLPARAYGAVLAGTVLLTWLARNVSARDARRAILLHLLVYDAAGAVVTGAAIAAREVNANAWAILAVYSCFAAGAALVLRSDEAR